MQTTRHLGDRGVHPVVAAAAQELLNKSDNERSGVLSTAMSFHGLYRDPVIAAVTGRSEWRIADLMAGDRPTSLYLAVPPGAISRTKPRPDERRGGKESVRTCRSRWWTKHSKKKTK